MANERYNIWYGPDIIAENLTQEEYFDRMGDLSSRFYETGHPHPTQLQTEIITDSTEETTETQGE